MGRASRSFVTTGLLWGSILASIASGDELLVGDAVPEFKGLDDQGQLWDSRDHIGKQKYLVVYFYHSDFSFCSTRQAVRYRDRLGEFQNLGVEVVGVSGDAVEAHRLFQEKLSLKFPLLSDGNGDVARKFGVPLRSGGKALIVNAKGQAAIVPRDFTAAHWTFVIGKDGRVLYRETEVSPVKDCQEVLEFLRKSSPGTP